MALEGCDCAHITEGRSGKFTRGDEGILVKRASAAFPMGYELMCKLATEAKAHRKSRKHNPVIVKLGGARDHIEIARILEQGVRRKALERHLDVALYYKNSITNVVIVATSHYLIEKAVKKHGF